MFPQLRIHIAVHRPLFHHAVIIGFRPHFTPISVFTPFSMDVLQRILRGGLRVDLGHKEPAGVGAALVFKVIAVVTGIITAVGAGIHRAVKCVEDVISTGLFSRCVVRIPETPVIIQIAGDLIGVNYGFCGLGAARLHRGIVVGTIQAVALVKTGGPGLHIGHRGGFSFLGPVAAKQFIAFQHILIRCDGDPVCITVLRLGLDQSLIHTLGSLLAPVGVQILRKGKIHIAAVCAGALDAGISLAITGDFRFLISMTNGRNRFFLHLAAQTAGTAVQAVVNTVRSLDLSPLTECMSGGGIRLGIYLAADLTGIDDLTGIGAGCRRKDGALIVVAAGILIDGRRNHHKVFFHQIDGSGIGPDHAFIIQIIVDVAHRNIIGMLARIQRAKGCIIINIAALEGVGISGNRIRIAGNRIGVGAEALIDVGHCRGKPVILRRNIAADGEGVSPDMGGGCGGISELDVCQNILFIMGDLRTDIGIGLVIIPDLVPQFSFGIFQQLNRRVAFAPIDRSQTLRFCLYILTTGKAHNRTAAGNGDLAVGIISGTLRYITTDRCLGHRTVMAENRECAAVFFNQFLRSEIRTLQHRRSLFRDLNGGQVPLLIIDQVGNQHNVTHAGRVQRVTQLQRIVNTIKGHRAQVGEEVPQRGAVLPVNTPAHGNKGRTVGAVICRSPAVVLGLTGVVDAVFVSGHTFKLLQCHAVANEFTGVHRLGIGQTIRFTFIEDVVVTPAINGLLTHPCGVVEIIAAILDPLLVDRPGFCPGGCRRKKTQQHGEYQTDTQQSGDISFHITPPQSFPPTVTQAGLCAQTTRSDHLRLRFHYTPRMNQLQYHIAEIFILYKKTPVIYSLHRPRKRPATATAQLYPTHILIKNSALPR